MLDALRTGATFVAILNPFALCLYLGGAMDELDRSNFFRVLLQASTVSLAVFLVFALLGESVLAFLGIQPGALRLFGGLIFLAIAYQYVSRGYHAAEMLRGRLEDLPSAIAVPFMIGAGTITQAILIGKRHDHAASVAILVAAIAFCLIVVAVFYGLRAMVTPRVEPVFNRYINLLARLNGLIIGAFSVDMIFSGAAMMLEATHMVSTA